MRRFALLAVFLGACSSPPHPAPPEPTEKDREVAALLAEGGQLAKEGKHREAAERFKNAVVEDPKSVKAQYGLGAELEASGEWKLAAEAYERVIQLDPKLQKAHHALGEVAFELGDRSRARRELEAAIALDPKDSLAWIDVATVEVQDGKPQEAVRRLERATETLDEPDLWYHLGYARELASDKRAAEAYERTIKMDPRHAYALNNLALLREARRDVDEAIALLERAIEANPRFPEAEKNLGIVLYKTKGKGYFALAHLEAYVRFGGRDARVPRWIAEIREATRTYRTDDRAFAVLDRIEQGKLVTADQSFPLRDAAVADKANGLKKGDRILVVFESATSSKVAELLPAK